MKLTPDAREFIENHIDLIQKNDFETFFKQLVEEEANINQISAWLYYEAGVDWLEHVSTIKTEQLTDFHGKLIIPANIKTVEPQAALESQLTTVTFENPDTEILGGAFTSCSKLTSVKLPSALTGINDFTFQFCKSLKEITIPDTVTAIRSFAFDDVPLESITIPRSVKYISPYAFWECPLKKVIIENPIPDIFQKDFPADAEIVRI